MPKTDDFVIVVDTRERIPYEFEGRATIRRALKTGDYSIDGLESRVTVERKRPAELFACAGRDRKRFSREMKRMASFDHAIIIVEGTLAEVAAGDPNSSVSPKAVINSLISWGIRYGVHSIWASDRRFAEAWTLRTLDKFWKHRRDDAGK